MADPLTANEREPGEQEFRTLVAPFIDRLDLQARDLGAKNERIEALERRIRDLHDEMQAMKGAAAEAAHETVRAITDARRDRENAVRLAAQNRELTATVRELEASCAALRGELDLAQNRRVGGMKAC